MKLYTCTRKSLKEAIIWGTGTCAVTFVSVMLSAYGASLCIHVPLTKDFITTIGALSIAAGGIIGLSTNRNTLDEGKKIELSEHPKIIELKKDSRNI